jgi:hypothetical protein
MNAPKFTPGPWVQVPQHGAGPMICHEYKTENQMNPTGLRLVCHILQRRDSLEQDEANAALINAAPELYEALEWALDRISFAGLGEGDYYQQACAALRKAIQP